ncbi:MAG TPA: SusD/RagB family nutrient-binding outer membrane lipoprotein [Bacteroidia bacterium]|nr:SusD/RagB family nutrient-binding outer membrane lipoprotein [Bacteroidia bacterium]
MKKFRILLLAGVLFCQLFSCKKDFDTVNTNPNGLSDAPYTNVLSGAILNLATTVDQSLSYSYASAWAQQIARTLYQEHDIYQPRDPGYAWRTMYLTAFNLQKLIDKADATPNRKGVAMVLKAYAMQVITDMWGDVPYADAFKGDEGNFTPKYSDQRSIYLDLVSQLKTANQLLSITSSGTDDIGAGDHIYFGDVSKWQKFCNSLLLRVYIRMSAKEPAISKQGIEEIFGDPVKFPVFVTASDNATLQYINTPNEQNPIYSSYASNAIDVPSKLLTTMLKTKNDPRLLVYADSATDKTLADRFNGLQNGASVVPTKTKLPSIGYQFVKSPVAPTYLLTSEEVLFIAAEAANNGWSVGITAKKAYEDAISANMSRWGISTGSYLSQPTVDLDLVPDKGHAIAEQKWLALYFQGCEAFSEVRRTGWPVLVEAPASVYPGLGVAVRLPYPTSESATNAANLSAVTAGIQHGMFGKKMWWANQ